MTKRDAIRKALRGQQALDIYAVRARVENTLKQVIGRADIYSQLGMMQTAGEIKVTGQGDERRYELK